MSDVDSRRRNFLRNLMSVAGVATASTAYAQHEHAPATTTGKVRAEPAAAPVPPDKLGPGVVPVVTPDVPDMRLGPTQSLTDGELYAIIQDGIRLTGMPAWGKEGDENDEDSWKLVHLIRHLKELTSDELAEMKAMNPKNPDEWEEERQEKEFLSGSDAPPDESKPKAMTPHHKMP